METLIAHKEHIISLFTRLDPIRPGDKLVKEKSGQYTAYDQTTGKAKGIVDVRTAKRIAKSPDGPTIMENIGEMLRKARMMRGLNQEQLGLKVRSSKNYIHLLEKGKTACSIPQLEAICKELNFELKITIKRSYTNEQTS